MAVFIQTTAATFFPIFSISTTHIGNIIVKTPPPTSCYINS